MLLKHVFNIKTSKIIKVALYIDIANPLEIYFSFIYVASMYAFRVFVTCPLWLITYKYESWTKRKNMQKSIRKVTQFLFCFQYKTNINTALSTHKSRNPREVFFLFIFLKIHTIYTRFGPQTQEKL